MFQNDASQTPANTILLPYPGHQLKNYKLRGKPCLLPAQGGRLGRIAYAAAHVIVDPLAEANPFWNTPIDWEATLGFREYLWSLGLGVAEAMDTAQRGMGLDWPHALELIKRSAALAKSHPGALIASGCGTDQLSPDKVGSVDEVLAAYEDQASKIEATGSRLIIMASRALARIARSQDDYYRVYDTLLRQARDSVIVHWLGPMFDPALEGYWGHSNFDDAMNVVLKIINDHAYKVDGIKISLLDKKKEIKMRQLLPQQVRMYTGDDFNYPELIEGDVNKASDALLGAFAAIAPIASSSLQKLALGNNDAFHAELDPTLPLSRHIFSAPTQFYKTGIALMAFLNGQQNHFTMLGAQEGARSTLHLAETFRLADEAGAFLDPELALFRMKHLMLVRGVI